MAETNAPSIITIITQDEARRLIATAKRIGYATTTASGKFIAGYELPNGNHIDHYLNFGWSDKFILSPAGYTEPATIPVAREW